MSRSFVFLLLFLLFSVSAMADTRHVVTANMQTYNSQTYYEVVILPNQSLVMNTSITLFVNNAPYLGVGTVTFFYNDSTSEVLSRNVSVSQSGTTFYLDNPYRGKLVDKIGFQIKTSPEVYNTINYAGLTVIDFWTRNPSLLYTVKVRDLFTNDSIGGFCALFSTGVSNETACVPTSGAPFFDGSEPGWGGMSRFASYERYLNSWVRQPNITVVKEVGGVSLMATPWYTSSSFCSSSYLNTGCGIDGAQKNNNNYFCIVTDELSQYCLAMSMSTNSTNEQYLEYCYNAITALNATAGGYGTLTEWTVRYDNRSGTPTIDKSYTNDNAADSDLRFIISLYNWYNNDAFTNTAGKNNAKAYADTMCQDIVTHNILQTTKTSNSNNSRTINYWPAGGGNVKNAGLTGNDFMYSGYYGDYLLAMGACGQMTGNNTYFTIADHIFENLLAAANWTPTTGFRVPPGRAFKWSNTATPTATCTTVCGPSPYIDDPDGKRMTKVCSAEAVFAEMGLVLHPQAKNYCQQWYDSFNSLNAYANEWWTNGTRKSSIYAAVDTNGLATHIDLSANRTNAIIRANFVGTNQYNTGTETFDSTSCQGIYNPGLAFESYGFLISPAFSTTMGFSGANSCSGGGPPETFIGAGLSVTLHNPVNNSNLTTNSVLLDLGVFNLNSTSAGGSPDPLVKNCSFTSDGCGFDLTPTGGVLNISSTTTANFGITSYTWSNITMSMNAPTGGNGHKFRVTSGGGAWILDGDCWKEEPGYTVNKCGFTLDSFTTITFLTNHTSNTSSICFGGSCSSTPDGGFGVVPGQNNVQIETTYAGGKVLIDNLTMRVLLSEAPSSGGSENSTLNVTFRNGLTNDLLYSVTGVLNGTRITYNWTGLTPNTQYYWYANVSSHNNNARFGNFTFRTVSGITNYDYCNFTGQEITHNIAGNYSLLIYNITNFLSTQQYFNISIPFLTIDVNDKNYYPFDWYEAYQSVGVIGALQLFTNHTINAFRASYAWYHNDTNNGQARIPLPAGNNSVMVNVSGNYTKTFTVTTTPLSTVYANATDIFDTIYVIMARFAGQPVNNFTVNMTGNLTNASIEQNLAVISTSNGTVLFPALRGYTFQFYANSTEHVMANTSLTTNSPVAYYNFSLLIQNTFELYFRNETSNALLDNHTIRIELISNSFAANYTTNTGNITITLLTPDDYTIHYWLTDEVKRDYYTTLQPTTYQNLTLYVVDEDISNFYIPVVYNEKSSPIEGATVKLLRYYVDCNCYRTVEMSRTDANGQAVLRVVPNTINYKLIITKDAFSMQTSPAKFTSSTNPYTLITRENPLKSLKLIGGVSRSFVYNNDTDTYIYTWSDDQGLVSGACMEITKYKEGRQTTEFTSCVTGATGSIIHTITDKNNTRYEAIAFLETTTEFSRQYENQISLLFRENRQIFGKIGVIITLLLFLAIVMATTEGGTAATIVGGVVAIVVMATVGVLVMEWTSIVGIIIIGAIIVYKLRS